MKKIEFSLIDEWGGHLVAAMSPIIAETKYIAVDGFSNEVKAKLGEIVQHVFPEDILSHIRETVHGVERSPVIIRNLPVQPDLASDIFVYVTAGIYHNMEINLISSNVLPRSKDNEGKISFNGSRFHKDMSYENVISVGVVRNNEGAENEFLDVLTVLKKMDDESLKKIMLDNRKNAYDFLHPYNDEMNFIVNRDLSNKHALQKFDELCAGNFVKHTLIQGSMVIWNNDKVYHRVTAGNIAPEMPSDKLRVAVQTVGSFTR